MTLNEELELYHYVLETHHSSYVEKLRIAMEQDMKQRYELNSREFNQLYKEFIEEK